VTTLPATVEDATARALGRLRRSAVRSLVAGVVLLAAFVAVASVIGSANDELRSSGVRTAGTIYTLYPDQRGNSGHADVRFVVGGRERFGAVDLGAEADGYAEGQRVTVYYDRADPSRMTIDDVDNQPGWTVLPMFALSVGALAGFLGAAAFAFRRRRAARLLAREPWQRVRVVVRYADKRSLFTTPDGSVWRGSGPWPTYNSEPGWRAGWGLPDLPPEEDPPDQEAWWVHDERTAVFSPDRGEPLLLARRRRSPQRARGSRRS
jgi:hypothetical protein